MISLTLIIFIFICAIILGLVGVGIYNGLISLRNQVERAWANIDVVLKQRFDEIPQLIQIIEQYVGHENNIIKSLAEARSNYGQARSVKDKINASQEMNIALQGIAAIGENYPELKSNNNFTQLQGRISHLENTISDRREGYNDAVATFNTRIDQFPSVFVARLLNYQRQELFRASTAERSMPSLKMNLSQKGA